MSTAFRALLGGLRVYGCGVGLEGEQPGIQDRAERARRERRGPQRFPDPPVDGLKLVQRSLSLGDLHLGGGEGPTQRPLGDVAGEERLTGAVFAPHRLERRPTAANRV